jgi:thioredoxin 1
MVALLATKADFDKALADAGSKLVASIVRRLAPALAPAQGHSLWPGREALRPLRYAPPPLAIQVVVDFTATWCGPCQRIAPVFSKLADEMTDVCFVKVDVDENAEVAEECGIQSMPTFQFYKSGVKVHEFSGASEDKIKGAIAQFK